VAGPIPELARLREEGAGFLAGFVPVITDRGVVEIVPLLDGYTVPDHLRVFSGSRRIIGDKPVTEEPQHPPVSQINGGCSVCTPPKFVPFEKGVGTAFRGDHYPVLCGVQRLTLNGLGNEQDEEND